MARATDSLDHSLPAVHALHLADAAAGLGVDRAELFSCIARTPEQLAEPDARLSLDEVRRLVERARELTGEPGVGLWVGIHMRVSAHGYLGFAAMTATTVRDALELAQRYAPTRTTALALRLEEHGDRASLVIEERADFGSARDAILLALIVGIWQIGCALTGRELDGDAEVAFEQPDYVARFAEYRPGRLRFGQPSNRLLFDASVLDLPLVMADPAAQRLAREQCEQELTRLGRVDDFAGRVRAALASATGGFRGAEEVARALGVSSRTLKRRLAQLGTSYSALLDEQRRERATALVRAGQLTLEQVASELGYSDTANFTRAFRRWTGKTPAAYRAEA